MEFPDAVLVEFAKRTLKNLALIRCVEQQEKSRGVQPDNHTVFPVTQQVNCFLGLVVFLEEGSLRVPNKAITTLVGEGWPRLKIISDASLCQADRKPRRGCDDANCTCVEHRLSEKERNRCQSNHKKCTTLPQLIRVLRNGVSHFHITFTANRGTKEIESIEVWNQCSCCNKRTTTVELSVEQARDFTERFAGLMIQNAAQLAD